MENPRAFLEELFTEAVQAALPAGKIPDLRQSQRGRTFIVAAGKGAASMAKEVEQTWSGEIEGIALTRYQHGLDLKHIRVIEAGHPVPDEEGEKAAREILQKATELTEEDCLICLISGGGSALLSLPAEGISFGEKKAINKALLKSGANIQEMNTVRKKLSSIKGGRLAVAAWPAKVITYLISDVPGDDPSVIASGPTVPDDTGCADALRILDQYSIDVSEEIRSLLLSGKLTPPAADHPVFNEGSLNMIATPQDALQAAANLARRHDIHPIILGDKIEGEAKEVAKVMAGITRQVLEHDEPQKKPCVILSGGETTVTVTSSEISTVRGGRNAEFLLAFAAEMEGQEGVYAIAADTDGIDGTEDNAGAYYDPETGKRAQAMSLHLQDYLVRHDAYSFFDALGDLLKTGPTRTNVNDFRAILVL
ncbi:MAG: glycerate kinase [Sneathiellales bacterium]|nr:glycerate kinase [Sneathiellales bacterium]